MNIDRDLLKQLSVMDQKELTEKIEAVSRLMGMDASHIKSLIGNPDDIQKKLQGLNEKDIKNISQRIDPELIKKLNAGDKNNGK